VGGQVLEEQAPEEPSQVGTDALPGLTSKRPDDVHPIVVLGVDGMDWRVVNDLWSAGKMPNLSLLCDEGFCTESSSKWSSSPMIWSTVATGVTPERHGIDAFVNETMEGRFPMSANDRKTAAIWNMTSLAGYKTAIFGWWASWPSEDIHGVVVSARAANDRTMDDRASPPAMQAMFDKNWAAALAGKDRFVECGPMARNDSYSSWWTLEMLKEDYDVYFTYVRCIDGVSHPYWGYWDAGAFPNLSPEDIESKRHIIPTNYEVVDEFVGEVLASMPEDANLFLLSDHGFHSTKRMIVNVRCYTDQLLEAMGYAVLDEDQDAIPAQSKVIRWHSAPKWYRQAVRFMVEGRDDGGTVKPEEVEALKQRLKEELKPIVYSTGGFAFRLQEPSEKEAEVGADAIIQVLKGDPTRVLIIDGREVEGPIGPITRNTGNHHPVAPPGVFIAYGPDIDRSSGIQSFRVEDLTPTVLFGLGLPVAEDFDGEAVEAIFNAEFRESHPKQTISSYGSHATGPVMASAADKQMIEELQALGYID